MKLKCILLVALFSAAAYQLSAQKTYVPDDNFEQALIDLGYDSGPLDDSVLTANISSVTVLNVGAKGIKDLTGIEAFVSLKELLCGSNQLTSLDLSHNVNLSSGVSCSRNLLTYLNVNNTKIDLLYCDNNNLTSLDLSNVPNLSNLSCFDNSINSLDLTNVNALRSLECDRNLLSSLDLTNNLELDWFSCSGNNLSELNLNNNVKLRRISCHNNQIKELFVNDLKQLDYIQCENNLLTNLDLASNISLQYLKCFNNKLVSLNVKNGNNANFSLFDAHNNSDLYCINVDNPDACSSYSNWTKDAQASYSSNCSRFNQTYVPDDHFEQALIDWGYDSGPLDDYVLTANISSVKNLSVHYKGITSLEGIQDFTALEYFNCEFNNLTSLDLTSNTSLMYLYCGGNNLPNLNLSTNSELIVVGAYLNRLNQIDVSASKHLLSLEVGRNNLTSLDITNYTELQYLQCDSNYLSVLDVSKNEKLQTLTCKHNNLTTLDLSNLINLSYLSCSENELISLDVSGNKSLQSIYCFNNTLSSLNLKNGYNQNMYFNALDNPNLFCIEVDDPIASENYQFWHKDAQATYTLDCARFNQKTYVPDDNFEQALIDLGCDNGPLDDYVPTMNIDTLHGLYLSGKGIESLEGIQDFVSLSSLYCSNNQLTSLSLSCNAEVTSLICSNNLISTLDVSKNKKLYELWCDQNEISSLDISSATNLFQLVCFDNKITDLDLSNMPLLRYFQCYNNALTSLNVKNGNNSILTLASENNPDLYCIEVDDPCAAKNNPHWHKDDQAGYSSDCSSSGNNYDYHSACESFTWIDGKTYTESNHSAKYLLQSNAGCDSIVTLSLSILKTFGTDTQTACDSFTWIDGKTYTESNFTAIDTLMNAEGCDSMVTLNLTINHSTHGTLQQTGCESYTWIDGKTYYENNNTATYNYTNAEGCPSVATLDLTISHPTTGTDVQTACDSLVWIDGKTYKENNNTATYTLRSVAGCDSVVTLNLTVVHSSVGTDVQSVCDSLVWIDGKTYTEDNHTATFALTNAEGCDSIVTLDLTILHSSFGTDVHTVCDSLKWMDGKTYTESNNTATYTLTNAIGCDSIIILDLTVNHSTYRKDVQTACDEFTWIDGKTYTESNHTATYTMTNAVGCDSVIILDLTVNHSWSVTDLQSACDTFTWIDGKTYTESNHTATYLLTTKPGCDSLVTLDLSVNHPSSGTDVQTACDSFVWIDGKTYTESNQTATYTLTNSIGCDSVVTLNLTVLHSTSGTYVQSACDSFTWIDGKTYTESNNTATFTLTNEAGCDSVVALNLTLKHSTYRTDTQTACDEFTWIDGNTYTESNHSATYVLPNAEGCDSVISLDLTVNHSYSVTDVQTACDEFKWIDGNIYTESNNTATYHITTMAGCDSIVTLDLTVNHPSYGTDVQVACDSFTWIDGITYTENNQTATYILTNSSGCDSLVTLDLTINNIDNTISQNGAELTANQNDASYQWFNCENDFSMIIGAKAQSYTALTNSLYSVVISQNGCVDTSAIYAVTTVRVIENEFGNDLIVFPNPTQGLVSINLGSDYDWIMVNVRSVDGKLIKTQKVTSVNHFELNIEGERGNYLLELISSDQKRAMVKILKE